MTPLQKALSAVSRIGRPEMVRARCISAENGGCFCTGRCMGLDTESEAFKQYNDIGQAASARIDQFSAGAMEVRDRGK